MGFKTTWIPVPPNWQKLAHHPFACVIEFGGGIDLDGMRAHMRRHGYDHSEPIILWRPSPKGPFAILAGRHRHWCCVREEITPTFHALEGGEEQARAFALKDIHRRHLTAGQRAMIVTALLRVHGGEYVTDVTSAPQTQGEAAKLGGVSRKLVNEANRIHAAGTPGVVKAAASGAIGVSDAAAVVNLPPDQQDRAVADVLAGKAKTARGAAKKRGGPQKDGEAVPTWQEVAATSGPFIRMVDKFFRMVNKSNSLQHQGVVRRWKELLEQLKKDHRQLTKEEG